MKDSKNTRDRRQGLGLFCYYKGLTLPMKWYSVIWKWTHILQTLGKPLKKVKKKKIWHAKKREKIKSYKKLNYYNKRHKKVEDKNWNKEQGQQIETVINVVDSNPNISYIPAMHKWNLKLKTQYHLH